MQWYDPDTGVTDVGDTEFDSDDPASYNAGYAQGAGGDPTSHTQVPYGFDGTSPSDASDPFSYQSYEDGVTDGYNNTPPLERGTPSESWAGPEISSGPPIQYPTEGIPENPHGWETEYSKEDPFGPEIAE